MAPLGVGDCIAITDLLIKIVKVFKESGGAAEEYQDVEEHAIALNAGFGHLRILEQNPANQTPDAFVQTLGLCEKNLQKLYQRREKYGPSLGKNTKANKLSGTFRRMQWALMHSKDTKDLRAALSSEMVSAVLVLQAQLIEASTKLTHESTEMYDLIENLHTKQDAGFNSLAAKVEQLKLDNESKITDAINAVVQNSTTTEPSILGHHQPRQTCSSPRPNGTCNADELLRDALASFEVSMENGIQRLMGSIQIQLAQIRSMEQVSTRIYLQDPSTNLKATMPRHQRQSIVSCVKRITTAIGVVACLLIDALCLFWVYFKILGPFFIQAFALVQQSITLYRRPILSPCDGIALLDALDRTHYLSFLFFQDYEVFKRGVRAAFRDCPGQERVDRGFYVFHNVRTREVLNRSNWNQTVYPGAKVEMSILITEFTINIGSCPRSTCQFPFKYQPKRGLAFECPKCHVAFRVAKMSETLQKRSKELEHVTIDANPILPRDDISKLKRIQMFRGFNGQPREVSAQKQKVQERHAWEGENGNEGGSWGGGVFYCCNCRFGPMGGAIHPACISCGVPACASCCWESIHD